jgi:hypothetical protein
VTWRLLVLIFGSIEFFQKHDSLIGGMFLSLFIEILNNLTANRSAACISGSTGLHIF